MKTPIINMTALDRAFAAIWAKNPELGFDQVMELAKAAVKGLA